MQPSFVNVAANVCPQRLHVCKHTNIQTCNCKPTTCDVCTSANVQTSQTATCNPSPIGRAVQTFVRDVWKSADFQSSELSVVLCATPVQPSAREQPGAVAPMPQPSAVLDVPGDQLRPQPGHLMSDQAHSRTSTTEPLAVTPLPDGYLLHPPRSTHLGASQRSVGALGPPRAALHRSCSRPAPRARAAGSAASPTATRRRQR